MKIGIIWPNFSPSLCSNRGK